MKNINVSLRANYEKCEAFWIGGPKACDEKPVKCRWVSLVNGTIKILGIRFSYDKQLAQKEGYKSLRYSLLLNLYKQQL